MSDEQDIREVYARYVRATDRRDGKAQGSLFTDDAVMQIKIKTGPDAYETLGDPLIGGAGIEWAVNNLLPPHPPGGSSHHLTLDHIIEIDGDQAHVNAQFIVFETRAIENTVRATESGYYDTDLRRIDGDWKIVGHRALMDVPPRREPV